MSATERLSWAPLVVEEEVPLFDPWEVADVSAWELVAQETRGVRPKYWVVDETGARWLRKEPRASRPFEPSIETFVLRLARVVGIPAPRSAVCTWTESGEKKRGIVVRSFADAISEGAVPSETSGRQLQDGAVILAREDQSYVPELHRLHSLSRVRRALESLENSHQRRELLLPFTQLLAFDAWVGNTDRHQHNWAVLWDDGRPSLAPLYDPAACLGVELTDEHPLLVPATRTGPLTNRYVLRAPSGFGNEARMLKLAEVVAELSGWPTWSDNVNCWLATFEKALDTHAVEFLTAIPPSWLPPARRELAIQLLHERLHWLRSQLKEGAR